MQYQAILFDLDGTLLPMDTEQFTTGYFQFLAKKLAPYGIAPGPLVAAVWAGTKAMMKNDGSRTNEDAFWQLFTAQTGLAKQLVNPACLEFYGQEFHAAKQFTAENPLAAEAVRLAHQKAPLVALATNPLFPMCGQVTRLSWLGLTPADFDLVTSYEADTTCKPNPEYFRSVCARLGVAPQDCLMIGNDEREDMAAATAAGLHCYCVTDCLIPCPERPWNGPRGSFAQLVEYLRGL